MIVQAVNIPLLLDAYIVLQLLSSATRIWVKGDFSESKWIVEWSTVESDWEWSFHKLATMYHCLARQLWFAESIVSHYIKWNYPLVPRCFNFLSYSSVTVPFSWRSCRFTERSRWTGKQQSEMLLRKHFENPQAIMLVSNLKRTASYAFLGPNNYFLKTVFSAELTTRRQLDDQEQHCSIKWIWF